jgi:hypothetical protein
MKTFVFWMVFMIPGHPPTTYSEPVATIDECLDLTREVLSRELTGELLRGGSIQAGCTMRFGPAQEG